MQSLQELLKDLGMGEDGEGGNDEEIAGVLEKMMGQLMSKEILYDPLKELHDKFPAYMANPPEPLSAEDKTRYEAQMVCVGKIVQTFDSPSYNDNNALEVKKVVDLMSEVRFVGARPDQRVLTLVQMQGYGSPPESIMGPLPPGMGFGNDGMPQLPDECSVM